MKFLLGIILAVSVGFGVFIMAKKNSEVDARPVFRKDSIPLAVDKNIVAYPDPNPFVQGALKEFEGFIKTVLANRQAPGAAVAIVRDTSIILLKGYGLRDTKKTDSINTHTIFRLGSVSKSVTATLVAILVNEGILHWDDPVINYLPDFRLKSEEATKKLTLRHLLSHTIGLPYHAYTILIEDHTPFDTLIDHLKDLDL